MVIAAAGLRGGPAGRCHAHALPSSLRPVPVVASGPRSTGARGAVAAPISEPPAAADVQSSTPRVPLSPEGTHNPWAPPFDFLQKAFLPLIRHMGPKVEATLTRAGFYPAGGGRFTVDVEPEPVLRRIDLLDRGEIVRQSARAVVSRLPLAIWKPKISANSSWSMELIWLSAHRLECRSS